MVRLVKATDPAMFESYLESYLKTGWRLHGNLVVLTNVHHLDAVPWFFQLVVKEES